MKLHGLVKVKANGSATRHAITTPGVKPFEEIRAKANVSWVSELHGQGLKPAKRSRKSYAVNRTGRSSKHGISEVLFQEFPHATKRGAIPHAFMKALIVFEEYGRDTSYNAIAAALEVHFDTAKEYIRDARVAVRTSMGIELISAGDTVRLVVANDAREKAIRVLNVFEQHVEPALKKLQACTKSLAASNVPLMLPARALAILEASKVDAQEVA
jgi:hypothetical protein